MDTQNCPFCQHGNPADSKYCSECGGCLYLVPCASCGAINDVKAVACYQCHGQLRAGNALHGEHMAPAAPLAVVTQARETDILTRALEVGSLEPALAPPATALPFWRRYAKAIAGAAALALIAGLGYYGYRYQMPAGATQATAAGGEARARSAPASSGSIRGEPAASAGTQGKAATATATSAAAAAAAPPEAAAAIGAVNVRTDRAGAAATRSGACSDAQAALGLCTPAPAEPTIPAVTHTMKKE